MYTYVGARSTTVSPVGETDTSEIRPAQKTK